MPVFIACPRDCKPHGDNRALLDEARQKAESGPGAPFLTRAALRTRPSAGGADIRAGGTLKAWLTSCRSPLQVAAKQAAAAATQTIAASQNAAVSNKNPAAQQQLVQSCKVSFRPLYMTLIAFEGQVPDNSVTTDHPGP